MNKSHRRVVVASLKRGLARAALDCSDPAHRAAICERLQSVCDRFPDRDTAAKPMTLEEQFKSKLEPKPTTERVVRNSKRRMLGLLPDDWRERVIMRLVSSRSKHVVCCAILACFGLRPEELSQGVTLTIEGGEVRVAVVNSKQRDSSSH